MKITMLFSATPHSSLSHRGLSFATGLSLAGHDVTIVAPSRDKYSSNQDDTPTSENGVRFVYPAMGRKSPAILSLLRYTLNAALHIVKTKTDMVIITKPTPLTIIGLLAKLRPGTKIVVDIDDLGSEVMAIEKQAAYMVYFVKCSEKLAQRFSDAVVVASRLLEKETTRDYPTRPVLRLSNGVDATMFSVHPTTRSSRIIFFGALNRASLLLPALEALPAVVAFDPKLRIEILGGGTAQKELEAASLRLGLGSNVFFHGWTKLSDLNKYTQLGDIGLCIMPKQRTTAACSNQKVFQYMASGLCVVANSVGDLPLSITNAKTGVIVPAGDTEALSVALITILENQTLRVHLAKCGLQASKTTYNWQNLAAQLSVFLDLVQKGAHHE